MRKIYSPTFPLVLGLALTGLCLSSAVAAPTTWKNTGTDWNTAANWTAGLPPSGLGNDSTIFSGTAVTNANVSTSYVAAGINFTGSGYTISSSNTSTTLTLQSYGSSGVSGNWAIFAQNTSGTNTISAPLILNPYAGGATRNISVFGQSAGGTLTISGDITEAGGAIDLWLVGDNTGGTFNITGTNNSYTGGTGNGAFGGTGIGKNATVKVASLGNAGANGSLGKGAIFIGGTYVGGASGAGTLNYVGGGETSNKVITLGNTATISTAGATGALILTGTTIASSTAGATLTLTGSNSGNQITSNITNNGGTALSKTGTGSWALSGANTYAGATSVGNGTLLVNGTHTGAGAYTVSSGATLGGAGSITGATNSGLTLSSGAKLAPGSKSGLAGTLTLALSGTGTLNVSAAVGGLNTAALTFDLGATGSSDKVLLTSGALNIGSGVLNFDDFSFNLLSGFGNGTYTLFDTGTAITGTLGSTLTGAIGTGTGTLSLANSNNDVVLTVSGVTAPVPEPSTYILLGCGLAALALMRRRMS